MTPDLFQYPFRFDDLYARVLKDTRHWFAARMYLWLAERYQNVAWMHTLAAGAFLRAGEYETAIKYVRPLQPTVARLIVLARCYVRLGQVREATGYYKQARRILDD